MKFKIGDKVLVKDCEYGRNTETLDKVAEITALNPNEFDYQVKFIENGIRDYFNESELELLYQNRSFTFIKQIAAFDIDKLPRGTVLEIEDKNEKYNCIVSQSNPLHFNAVRLEGYLHQTRPVIVRVEQVENREVKIRILN